MNFNLVDSDEFEDILGLTPQENKVSPFKNVMQEEQGEDILFREPLLPIENNPLDTSVSEDILGVGEEVVETKEEGGVSKPGRKPKYDFSDMSGYFQDRFKNEMLIPLVDEENKPVELKTPEDFDLVIEENIRYQVDKQAKALENSWYREKSPAWQAVANYAEYVDDPSQLIPFLQGVDTINNIASIDENDIEAAESIVRYQKQLSGVPNDVIEEEVEALKATDKLISSAAKIKPALIQREQMHLAQLQKEAQDNQTNYWNMVEAFAYKAQESLDKPLFGKVKLQDSDKAEIYDLIGIPNEKLGGYAIYSEIDKLYEIADFDTLKEIALLLKRKDKYLNAATQREVAKSAETLQKKVRLATQPGASSGQMESPEYHEERPSIRGTSFKPFNSK